MHKTSKSCIIFLWLWMHTLDFVKSQEIKCELELLSSRGTTYEPANRNTFLPGENLRVTCGEREWILQTQSQTAETTCNEDGEWTVRPVCREVTCSRPQHRYLYYFHDSWRQQKLGATVRYGCITGYRRTEDTTWATCTREGWKPNPLCQEIKCGRRFYSNAEIHGEILPEYNYNDQVNYICKRGSEGRFTLTCGEDGWIGSNDCRVYCGRPPALEDGDVKNTIKEKYSHNEKVEYMCQSYHTMEGEPNRICINGNWTGHMRCIKPCIVSEDDMTQHNITLKSSDNKYFIHDEIIEFRCARGLPVGGVSMRQRCNSGVIVLPTCQESLG